MFVANPRPPNNGFTFLFFNTYTKGPDIETSDFLTASSVIVALLRAESIHGAKLFQLIQISNFNNGRSGRWHGLITVWPLNLGPDSFRQHFEIHWSQIKAQIKAATFFAES